MTLRRALTPSPRYIRAKPASMGLGFSGSGPGIDRVSASLASTKKIRDLLLIDGMYRTLYEARAQPVHVVAPLS